jgi:signal transduction histidine kinase
MKVFQSTGNKSVTNSESELQLIKVKLVDLLYWIIAIVMWFAILGTILRACEFVIVPLKYFQGIMIFFFLLLFLFRNILPYLLKSWLLLSTIFLLGAGGIITYGLLSQGTFFLFLFIILASIIVNNRWGIISMVSSILFLIVMAILFHQKLISESDIASELAYATSTWIMAILIFSIVSSITIIFWNKTQEFLTQKIESSNLHEENLQRINKLLTKEIESRKETETLLNKQFEDSKKLNTEHQAINKELKETNQKLEQSNILLQESKEKAQAADQLKASFLSNISHEIRTPMNAIVGFTTLLNAKDTSHEDTNRYLEVIQSSTNNLLQIITDIMNMAKLESGQYTLHPEEFDLNLLIEELSERYTREIFISKSNKIQFQIENKIPTPCFIKSDMESLRQISTKLIDNAIKFTEEGQINLMIELDEQGKLSFLVKDTGIGIAKKVKNEIYELFRQLDGENTRKYGGTGIGLAITKAFVELLNGNIEFASIPGKETIFSVRLPVIVHNKHNAQTTIKKLNIKDKSILLVGKYTCDDKKLKEILNETNAQLKLIENGIQAIELLNSKSSIDLIILNLFISDIKIGELTTTIKKKFAEIPILIHDTSEKETNQFILDPTWDGVIKNPLEKLHILQILKKYF